MTKACGLLTYNQFYGKKDFASSRIRAEWLCNYWPEAELFTMGQKYETVVFQKSYWLDYAKLFTGLKILDLCDPDYLRPEKKVRQMIALCDGVTASTQTLAQDLRRLTDRPVFYLPDRLDLNYFNSPKKDHHGDAKIAAWYGFSVNFPMLDTMIPILVKSHFKKLIVITDAKHPYRLAARFTKKLELVNFSWALDTVNRQLLQADLVINPQHDRGLWKYKSHNKTIAAWALGLPVAHNEKELCALIGEEARIKEADKRYIEVRKNYDVKKSVAELQEIIKLLKNKKAESGRNAAMLAEKSLTKKYFRRIKRESHYFLIGVSYLIADRLSVRRKKILIKLDAAIGRLGLFMKKAAPNLYHWLKNG